MDRPCAGEAVEKQGKDYLAQKAVGPGQQDLVFAEYRV